MSPYDFENRAHAVDVVIIGGGIVGCAVARKMALAGMRTVLMEKGADILSGASKANSAILHTGFDAPAKSLELELIQKGRQEYLDIKESLGLSVVKTSALVCAWNKDEADKLPYLYQKGIDNGVAELEVLNAKQARQIAPHLSDKLCGALHVKHEDIIDPWTAPLAYLTQAVKIGATFLRNTELVKGTFEDGIWQLQTNNGTYYSRAVINAAGLFGDIVDERLGFEREFTIKPRKGQFIVLDKAATQYVNCIILPVPNEITKGIVVCPTAFGNVLVGPTAEEQEDRTRATVVHDTLEMLKAKGTEIVPALANIDITAVYAGLRPGSDDKAYRVFARPDRHCVTLGGIRSTGLSASLGLAQHAVKLLTSFAGFSEKPVPAPTIKMPNLTEIYERDWQRDDHGEIVCHCEMVTRREIEATFDTPVPPGDFGGLKRRTRACMGRCQSFYCNSEVAQIIGDRFSAALTVNTGKTDK